MFDLKSLTDRYSPSRSREGAGGRAAAGRASHPDDLTAPAWVPDPLISTRPPSTPRSGGRIAALAAAALFAVGGMSVAFAAVRITSGAGMPTDVAVIAPTSKAAAVAEPEIGIEPETETETESESETETQTETETETETETGTGSGSGSGSGAGTERRVVTRPARRPSPPPSVPSEARPAYRWDTGGQDDAPVDRDLDDLLDAALGGAPQTTPAETPREALPDAPTARQVQTTLRALEGEVAQCIDAGSGTAIASLVIDGSTGRVRSVDVSGSPANACIERVVRTARFPRFARESFTVRYPYRY